MQERAIWKPVIVSDDFPISRKDDVGRTSGSQLHLKHAIDVPLLKPTMELADHRRGDIRFSLAVTLAFALPAFLSLGLYAAVHSLLLMAS
jgi:hypothetical protein